MTKKRLFVILDEMNVHDIKNNTRLVAVSGELLSVDKVNAGGIVKIGVDHISLQDLINDKAVVILAVIDREEYAKREKISTELTGAEEIAQERAEHINKHHWTAERDDQYVNDELTDAAMQYIGTDLISCWPESWDPKWYKPGDRIQELRRAGGMIAAEIDRLKRANKR